VQTLVGSTWVKTDSYSWGEPLTVNPCRGILSVTVKDSGGSIFKGPSQVIRYDSGYSFIDSITPSGGSALWPNIPQGSYNLELYSNSELWAKMQVSVLGGQTSNVALQRNQPLALNFKTFHKGDDVTGQSVSSGAALTHTIRVSNNAGLAKNATVRLLLDRDKLPPYDFESLTQPLQTISNGGLADFSASHTPSVPGTYYRQIEVITEDTPGNWVKTDSYSWGEPLTVKDQPIIFELTHFPVAGKGPDDPIINSVFDHKNSSGPDGAIFDAWGDVAMGPPEDKGNYPIVIDGDNSRLNPGFPGGGKIAYDNHNGIDYAGNIGDPVVAAASGTVLRFYDENRSSDRGSPQTGCGNYVEIKHAGGFSTRYLHLTQVTRGLSTGTSITSGDEIGTIGNTGLGLAGTTGKHLHFDLSKENSQGRLVKIDPYGWNCVEISKIDPYEYREYHPNGGYWRIPNQHSVVGQVFDAVGPLPVSKSFLDDWMSLPIPSIQFSTRLLQNWVSIDSAAFRMAVPTLSALALRADPWGPNPRRSQTQQVIHLLHSS
jgi:murein DD-endopeptidase MepM/ murein hydrolase activator NlpD